MITVIDSGVYYTKAGFVQGEEGLPPREEAKRGTIAYGILEKHNTSGNMDDLKLRFDAMASHDITYVGIIQTARASGMESFPLPYVLTNCHNSLCAVGGTINEDDHVFGLSAAKKYGGIYVPAHQAVIHSYMRERMAGCGRMLLGSDSHTRYGALGTLAVGEGGPELVKQLCNRTYDIAYPGVVAVELTGAPRPGVGPHDVAIALVGKVFKSGLVKNRIMEFVGPGIANLSVEYRNGIDVMTTETTCLSSVWATDERVKAYLELHGRGDAYAQLAPRENAYYDALIRVDLSQVEPMIALPFHPSNAYPIREFLDNQEELLREVERAGDRITGREGSLHLRDKVVDGRLLVDQAVVAGCAGGTYENLYRMAQMLEGHDIGSQAFGLSVYPGSQPALMEALRTGVAERLIAAGAVLRSAFCGPCFGAGDVPANNGFSIRHTTRNFENREGSKPANGQISCVALMDARSIAATALRGGRLTAATELACPEETEAPYHYDSSAYQARVYNGWGNPQPEEPLVFGPNIADWPRMVALPENLLLTVASALYDPVTTTDELIPSGETSSYRSNPLKLAEFALSRKDPGYVERAKAVQALETARREGADDPRLAQELALVGGTPENTGIGSLVFALKPGDGSAREQAASCQKVLGGWANLAAEYATKRYRSNVVNWGMLPLILKDAAASGIQVGDRLYLPGIRAAVERGDERVAARLLKADGSAQDLELQLPMAPEEREIVLAGCLINHYAPKQ